MRPLLGVVNLVAGFFLLFALSGIARWEWFALVSTESRLIVFILSVLLVLNATFLAFASEELLARRR